MVTSIIVVSVRVTFTCCAVPGQTRNSSYIPPLHVRSVTAKMIPSVYFPTSPVPNLTAVPSKRAIRYSMRILAGMLEGYASSPMGVFRVGILAFSLARTCGADHIKTPASENRVVYSVPWILKVVSADTIPA